MSQVLLKVNCPECGPQLGMHFSWDVSERADIIIEQPRYSDREPLSHIDEEVFVHCRSCNYKDHLTESKMMEILVQKMNFDNTADLFAHIVKLIRMQNGIKGHYSMMRERL